MHGRALVVALGWLALTGPASAGPSGSRPQSFAVGFESCLATIDQYARRVGVSPEVVADSPDLLSVRFLVRAATVQVTCSRRTSVMTISMSRADCEADGSC